MSQGTGDHLIIVGGGTAGISVAARLCKNAAKYNGCTSCPLVTGYDSLIMAEFGCDLEPQETFPFDRNKERYSMFLVKRYLLPHLYWHGMLKGRA